MYRNIRVPLSGLPNRPPPPARLRTRTHARAGHTDPELTLVRLGFFLAPAHFLMTALGSTVERRELIDAAKREYGDEFIVLRWLDGIELDGSLEAWASLRRQTVG